MSSHEPSSAEAPDLTEGDVLEPVMIGPPVRGRIATWHDDGRRLWALDDAQTGSALVGTGQLARMSREPQRFREVVMAPQRGSKLIAVERAGPDEDGTVTMASMVLATSQVGLEQEDADDAAWGEFAGWLTGVVVMAAQRGELVVVEAGGWPFTDEPFALAFAAATDDGGVMHIERAPAALPARHWPPSDQVEGQTISAPISAGTLELVGPLLTAAVRTWADSPHDVCLTFASTAPTPAD